MVGSGRLVGWWSCSARLSFYGDKKGWDMMGIFPRIWYDMAYDMGILSYYGYYHHIWGYQSWCGYDMEIVVQYRKNWHYVAFHQDGSVMDSHGDIWTIWRLLGSTGDQPFWVGPLGALQIWESKPGMVNSKIAGSSGCSPANVFYRHWSVCQRRFL